MDIKPLFFKYVTIIPIIILILFVFSIIPASSLLYSPLLTITSNKEFFKPNENVHLSGEISQDILDEKIPVTLYVFDPLGNIFLKEKLPVSNNTPNYNYQFKFDDSSLIGPYQILVEYKEIQDVIFLNLGTNLDNDYLNKTAVIKYKEEIYPIQYWLSDNVMLDKIGMIQNSKSIQFIINANSTKSHFQIVIPRILFDLKDDHSFTILRGGLGGNIGIATDVQISSDEKNHVLKIPLLDNAINSIIVQITDRKYDNQPYIPPLKQYISKTPSKEIQCRNSLILVIKYDDSPACVKAESKAKLIERGWTKSFS